MECNKQAVCLAAKEKNRYSEKIEKETTDTKELKLEKRKRWK